MKAIIEIEITGEFCQALDDDLILDTIESVIESGAESFCLSASYRLIEITDREDAE